MNFQEFLKILWSQNPTGTDGFEGLVRKLLEKLTGQNFFLSLSGRQEGRDTASEGNIGSYIAAECKRYQEGTDLGSDELLAKFMRAAMSSHPPDIWIVVTTKRLGEQHHRDLQRASDKFGISYFSIDAEGGEASRLAVLCSIAPELVSVHLKDNAPNLKDADAVDVEKYLSIRAEEDEISDLRQQLMNSFLNDAVGYGNWTIKQNTWLMERLSSVELSRAAFAQNIAIRIPESNIVNRNQATLVFDEWWNTWRKDFKPLIILGEEGDGKSWAVADWLSQKIGRPDFPPILVIPSILVSDIEPMDLITDVLRNQIGDTRQGFWRSRIERWLTSTSGENPLFLIVFDGLNERPEFKWQLLFSKLGAEPFAGRVAVLMTSRTLFWEERINVPKDGFKKWILPPYKKEELETALSQRGLRIKDFDTKLLPLLTKPRYLDLTLKLKDLLLEQGDVTVERLIYEDWRDRMSRKIGHEHPLTNIEFQELIIKLSVQWQEEGVLSREDVQKKLELFGDGKALLEELKEGSILRQEGQAWKINSHHLILGLGLILANEVKIISKNSDTEIDELIATWLEPHSDMDLKVAICGMALLHALHYEDYPDARVLALFRAWLRGRNIQADDWKRIPAYLPLQPEIYIKMAEHLWGAAIDNHEAQDAFMAGFLRFGHTERVKPILISAFERWLGFIHPNGHYNRHTHNEDEKQKNREKIITNLRTDAESGTIHKYGFKIELTRDSGLLRLASVALAVISHQEREPFVFAMAAYALSSAVIGYPNFQTEYCWVMRTSDVGIEKPVLEIARNLMGTGEPLAQKAAWWLLTSLYSHNALELRKNVPAEFGFKSTMHELYEQNPCAALFSWDSKTYTRCMEETDLHPTTLAGRLKGVAINPNLTIPKETQNELFRAFEGEDLNFVRCSLSRDPIDFKLDESEPALCAYYPERLACIWRLMAMVLPGRDPGKRLRLAWEIYEHLLIMGDRERKAIEDAWRSTLASDLDEDKHAEMILFPCVLWGKTLDEQLDLFDERGDRNGLFVHYNPNIAKLEESDLSTIAVYLENKIKNKKTVSPLLLKMLANALPKMNETIRNLLLDIFHGGEENIRSMCLYIFSAVNDNIASRLLIEKGWSAKAIEDEHEKNWGTVLLSKSDTDLHFSELADRILISHLGIAVKHRGCREEEVIAYGKLIHRIWLAISNISTDLTSDAEWTTVKTNCVEPIEELFTLWLTHEDQKNVTFLSWDSVWGGGIGSGNTDAIKNAFDMEARKLRFKEASERLQRFVDSEQSAGNPWLGRYFDTSGLKEVINTLPDYIAQWTKAVLPEEPVSDNLLIRCRSFYEALCRVLLDVDPELGISIFKRLRNVCGFRISDSTTGIESLLFILFSAKVSEHVTNLRNDIFNSCITDEALFGVTFLSELYEQYDELQRIIESWLFSGKPFNMARGLTLLGFMDSSDAEERMNKWIDGQPESWVRSRAVIAQNIYHRNQWAKHWFGLFGVHENDIHAWAAFRLFLKCVDRRFWLWGPKKMEVETVSAFRKRHYLSNKEYIRKAIIKNEKDILKLEKRLVGTDIKQKQVWPWMPDYE